MSRERNWREKRCLSSRGWTQQLLASVTGHSGMGCHCPGLLNLTGPLPAPSYNIIWFSQSKIPSHLISPKSIFIKCLLIHSAVENGLCPCLLTSCSIRHHSALWMGRHDEGKRSSAYMVKQQHPEPIRSAQQTLSQETNKQPSSCMLVSFPMQTVELLFAQFVEFELLFEKHSLVTLTIDLFLVSKSCP